jgi:predicted extracellular nuclease
VLRVRYDQVLKDCANTVGEQAFDMHKRSSIARLVLSASMLFGLVLLSCDVLTPSSPVTQIWDIQGKSHRSPMEGQEVQDVPGIVTAVTQNGFWMQAPTPDGDRATSDGIFVFTDSVPGVNVGDEVVVEGMVTEYRPGGEAGNTTITQITGASPAARSSGNELPSPVVIGAGGWAPPSEMIEDDATGDVETSGVYDPNDDGIDFYESLEGMRVQVNDALVVGPTNAYGEIWVVGDRGASATDLTPRGGVCVRAGDFNPERIQLDDPLYPGAWPDLSVGARLTGPAIGVLHYGFGEYELYVTEPISVDRSGEVSPETTPLRGAPDKLTIATLNVENLGGNASPATPVRAVRMARAPLSALSGRFKMGEGRRTALYRSTPRMARMAARLVPTSALAFCTTRRASNL